MLSSVIAKGLKDIKDEIVNEEEQMLKDIKYAHDENDLVENLSTLESLDKYQSLSEFSIPLKELYSVESACLHTEG